MQPVNRSIGHLFSERFGREAEVVTTAPGRVNLIGEHTDYNGGFVLPVAIDRTVSVAVAPADGRHVRVYAAAFDARDEWQVDAPRRTGRREWRDYLRGVAWALLDAGYELKAADIAIEGDIPIGSGLSSSAALEVAVGGALFAVAGIPVEQKRLALLCQKAENEFVGVPSGVMDQLAAVYSRNENAMLIDCRSLDLEFVPLPSDVVIVVVDSKVPRRLSETPYNVRRGECTAAAKALAVASLRDAQLGDIERLPDPLNRRARHVICENKRVLDAVEALRERRLQGLGALMNESHTSLRDDFEVSTPELDLLVELASRTPGVLGARLTGAGFGGCTANLLMRHAIAGFESGVVEAYRKQTGLGAQMMVCRAADGLKVSYV